MSLLMEALRKAELAKKQKQQDGQSSDADWPDFDDSGDQASETDKPSTGQQVRANDGASDDDFPELADAIEIHNDPSIEHVETSGQIDNNSGETKTATTDNPASEFETIPFSTEEKIAPASGSTQAPTVASDNQHSYEWASQEQPSADQSALDYYAKQDAEPEQSQAQVRASAHTGLANTSPNHQSTSTEHYGSHDPVSGTPNITDDSDPHDIPSDYNPGLARRAHQEFKASLTSKPGPGTDAPNTATTDKPVKAAPKGDPIRTANSLFQSKRRKQRTMNKLLIGGVSTMVVVIAITYIVLTFLPETNEYATVSYNPNNMLTNPDSPPADSELEQSDASTSGEIDTSDPGIDSNATQESTDNTNPELLSEDEATATVTESGDANVATAPVVAAAANTTVSGSGNAATSSAGPANPQTNLAQQTANNQQAISALATSEAVPVAESTRTDSAESPVMITRSDTSDTVPEQVQRGYQFFSEGDWQQAMTAYSRALESTPNSRDAMLGLASTYQQMGQIDAANDMYRRLLRLNPRDPLGRAGLLAANQVFDAPRREAELNALSEEFPSIAAIPYALGNLYAGQSRWREAQSAYFNALRIARATESTVNPDYAFNLAVSLENLRQPAQAYEYYIQAEQLADSSTPGFQLSLLRSRLRYLESLLQ